MASSISSQASPLALCAPINRWSPARRLTGVAALIALSSALLKKSVRGGLVVAGEVTLGGTIEPIHNAVTLAEIAVEKGAKALLLPVACRRQLFDLSDEMATKLASSSIKTDVMRF